MNVAHAAQDILQRASEYGLTFTVTGDRLRMRAAQKPPEDLLADIREHKPEIMAALATTTGFAAEKPQDGRNVDQAPDHPGTPSRPSGDSAGVPREWIEGFARLDPASPPKGFDKKRWRILINDGDRFLDQWGDEAARLGWTALDVFGVHPKAPGARYDAAGLVVLINGGDVISIKSDRATIQSNGGKALLTYLRRPRTGTVALWEIVRRQDFTP